MTLVQRDEVSLFFTDEGEGTPVLLIHGHTLDGRMWDQVTPGLLAAGLRVIRPDLRGHGQSSRPAKGYHWLHHATDMAVVLGEAGISSAVVVGFSLGGGVALELTLTRGDRVSGLVLIDPVMPDRPFEPAFLDNLRLVARKARAEGIRAAMLGPWMESPLFAGSMASPGVRESLTKIVGDFPGADYLASERDRVDRAWTVPQRLGEITVPTLVMAGERDLPGFLAYAEEAAQGISGARQIMIPGAGHLTPMEAPEVVARRLVAFVHGQADPA